MHICIYVYMRAYCWQWGAFDTAHLFFFSRFLNLFLFLIFFLRRVTILRSPLSC